MDNREPVENWHEKAIAESERRIGRALTDKERSFITSRGGFVALEMIEDTANSMHGEERENYPKSEKR